MKSGSGSKMRKGVEMPGVGRGNNPDLHKKGSPRTLAEHKAMVARIDAYMGSGEAKPAVTKPASGFQKLLNAGQGDHAADARAHREIAAHAAKLHSPEVASQVQAAHRTLGRDGLTRLPDLRKKLSQVERDTLDGTLIHMENQGKIQLKIANDPRAVDANAGIRIPGRGLIYYVVD